LPAYGLTGPNANNDYSMEAYSQFLKKFLDKINVKRCHLAGNSLGGGIVWNFALRFPEIAQKLILLDAAGYASKNKKGGALAFTIARTPVLNKLMRYITPRAIAEKTLRAAYFDQNKVSDTLIDRYFDMVLREGNREAFVARMTQKWDDNSAQIKTIAKPTLIMWGDHDNIIPVEMADLFTKDLPNDSLIIYKNVGHVPMEEIPTQSAKDALKFLYEK
jgi:pimeloyl-ACP methyl ester carboxylesterase